jgi:hypothetical protein
MMTAALFKSINTNQMIRFKVIKCSTIHLPQSAACLSCCLLVFPAMLVLLDDQWLIDLGQAGTGKSPGDTSLSPWRFRLDWTEGWRF